MGEVKNAKTANEVIHLTLHNRLLTLYSSMDSNINKKDTSFPLEACDNRGGIRAL